jgi:hypothetical protein
MRSIRATHGSFHCVAAPYPYEKGSDYNAWAPLQFDDNGNVLPLVAQSQITISVGPGPVDMV